MVIESSTAAARGTYAEGAVYFCSNACQKSYEKTHAPTSR